MSDGQATPPTEVTTDPSEDKPQGWFWRYQRTDTLLTIPDYKASMTVMADMLLMTSAILHQSRAFKLRSSDWSLTLSPRFANVA